MKLRRDYKCSGLEGEVEYMVWRGLDGKVTGSIPRDCMEWLGIDTGPLDTGEVLVWDPRLTKRMRRHRHFMTREEWLADSQQNWSLYRHGRGDQLIGPGDPV
jgi:hypothetical protein